MREAARERGRQFHSFAHPYRVAAHALRELDKIQAGQFEAGTLRTCITWLNERIAP